MRNNQTGFGIVEFFLSLVIVGLLGGAGYYVYDTNKSQQTAANNQQIASKNSTKGSESAPEIKKATDLDKALFALDQANPDIDLNEAASLEKDVNNL